MPDFKNCVKEIRYKCPWTGASLRLFCEYNTYLKGGIALELIHVDEDGYFDPYAMASVCVPYLEDDEIAIKDYGENAGMLEQLLYNKVIYPPHRYVQSGYVNVPVCKLIRRESNKIDFNNCVKNIVYTSQSGAKINLSCKYDFYNKAGIKLVLFNENEDGTTSRFQEVSECLSDLDDDEIAINDFFNPKMLEQLIDNKVIYPPHRSYPFSGRPDIKICRLRENKSA